MENEMKTVNAWYTAQNLNSFILYHLAKNWCTRHLRCIERWWNMECMQPCFSLRVSVSVLVACSSSLSFSLFNRTQHRLVWSCIVLGIRAYNWQAYRFSKMTKKSNWNGKFPAAFKYRFLWFFLDLLLYANEKW